MRSILPIKIFSTSGSEGLANAVFQEVQARVPPEVECYRGVTRVDKFSNENLQVKVDNVRDHMVVVIHTQVPPVNENLVELLLLLHALKNSRAGEVLLIFPYMPYARSDRKNEAHISSGGVLLPQILGRVLGVHRTLLLDPHDTHVKHYFEVGSIPAADEVTATLLMVRELNRIIDRRGWDRAETVAVFADAGAATRFRNVPELLAIDQAHINKARSDNSEMPMSKEIVGVVEGRHCLLVDDEILTGSTAVRDAERLVKHGAKSIVMGAIHAPLADKRYGNDEEVMMRLVDSPIEHFVFTDSIPCDKKIALCPDKFTLLTIAPLLGESIKRIALGQSLTELHQEENVALYLDPKAHSLVER
jgi:ribose-phosphate pyrophosphokinase